MKKLLTKAAAVFSAAALSLCSVSGLFTAMAEDEPVTTHTIIFNWQGDGVSPTKTTDPTLFETYTTYETYVTVPLGSFTKSGYTFTGWSIDGYRGYKGGNTVVLPTDAEEIVFEPMWMDIKDPGHTVSYVLELDGETIENPEWLEDEVHAVNEVFAPNFTMFDTGSAFTRGVTDGESIFVIGDNIVMPDHDLVLYPIFYHRITITYSTGDVDRIVGNNSVDFSKTEGASVELAAADRLSRSGFNLVGWVSSYDGETYSVGETVTMPAVDVTFTAVWEPKSYTVVFKQSGGNNIKVAGLTDTAITCPEPTVTVAGQYFAGWKDSTGEIHAAGSDYIIPGAIPGKGITLDPVWTTEPPATTTEPPVTTTEPTAETIEPSILGDANVDGHVSIADATAILQFLGNRDKYALKGVALANADVFNPGDGVTPKDALAIQQLDAKIILSLPVIE